ncbi:MAG TPA: cytochrome c [Nitrospira sp.]|nr:cytochrome c [Nitrospira sp.]
MTGRAPGLTLSVLMAGLIWSLPAAAVTADELEQGRALYERHCAACHGMQGRGDGKLASSLSPRPGNLVSAQTSAKSDQDLLKIIANGRPRTAMTGWNEHLSEEEQRAVLAYIRSLVKFSQSATPPPPSR